MKYTLKKPVVRRAKDGEDETIAELTVREDVVAGDMRGIAMRVEPLWDDMLKLAGRLCAQPDDVMNRLSFADATALIGLVGGFINGGPGTGNAP